MRKPSRKDLVTIYRITQLTKVILDDKVTELGDDTDTCTPIAASDKTEMEAARRTLHEYASSLCCMNEHNMIETMIFSVIKFAY